MPKPEWMKKKEEEKKAGSTTRSQSSVSNKKPSNAYTDTATGSSSSKTETRRIAPSYANRTDSRANQSTPVNNRITGPSEEKLQQINRNRTNRTSSSFNTNQNNQTQLRTSRNNNTQGYTDSGSERRTSQLKTQAQIQNQPTRTDNLSLRERNNADRTQQMLDKKSHKAPKSQQREDRSRLQTGEFGKDVDTVAKGAVKGALLGYGRTATDIARPIDEDYDESYGANAWNVNLMDEQDQKAQRAIREQKTKERTEWLKEAQAKNNAEIEKAKEGKTGLQKWGLDALESGIGMGMDSFFGPAWGVSMMARTYGTSLDQAMNEGATEDEARLYAFLQGAKETGTEYMFPGIGLAGRLKGAGVVKNSLNKVNPLRRIPDTFLKRYLGGIAEENAEEITGWLVDPYIKEFAYGKNVRQRQAQEMLGQYSDVLNNSIAQGATPSNVAAYLGSDEFVKQTIASYKEYGLSDKEAAESVDKLRAYLTAQLSGDSKTAQAIGDELSSTLANGKKMSWADWDKKELLDTVASTTLLTGVTGVPGTVISKTQGAQVKASLGTSGIEAMSRSLLNSADEKTVAKAQAVLDRIAEGKEVSDFQAYELQQATIENENAMREREQAYAEVFDRVRSQERLSYPMTYTEDGGLAYGEVTGERVKQDTLVAKKYLKNLNKSEGANLSDTQVNQYSESIGNYNSGFVTSVDADVVAYNNAEGRAAFQAVTGEDLNKYVVYKKDGSVDVAATNAKTYDAFFAKAADNLIQTARVEQENWNDESRGIARQSLSENMEGKGSEAIGKALDTVDPRDRDVYYATGVAARRVYDVARFTNNEWNDVAYEVRQAYPGVSPRTLKNVFEAAKQDKKDAETAYYGEKVGGKNSLKGEKLFVPGKFVNNSQRIVKNSEAQVIQNVCTQLGIDVEMSDNLAPDENGSYSKEQRKIVLNSANTMGENLNYIFSHEVTHHLAAYATDEYLDLSRYVMDAFYKSNPEAFKAAIKSRQDLYKRARNQDLSAEMALEEIIADNAIEFWSNEDFINEITTQKPTFAEAIINAIKNILSKLRAVVSGEGVTEEDRNTLYGMINGYEEARKLWLRAYNAARSEQATQAINDKQDEMNKGGEAETKYSIETESNKISSYSTAAYSGQVNMRTEYKDGDKVLGYVDWNIYEGTPNISYIEVNEENRRQGIARAMLQDIQKNYPDKEINFGMTTEDGTALIDAITEEVVNEEVQAKQNEIKDKKAELEKIGDRINELVDKGVLSEEEDAELEKIGPEWDALNLEIHNLEDEIEGESASQRFVKYSIVTPQQDSDYMAAVESGDMETAQRMVDELAKQKGYSPRLFHGSSAFGFTEFDLNEMDDKTSIFLTDNEEIASTYSGKPGRKAINERSNLDYENMSEKELVDRLNDANIIISDEEVSYDYYDANRVEELKGEIENGLNTLSEIVDSKVTEYADRMAKDFDDTDMKTHKQLIQLKKKLDLYKEVKEGKRHISNPDGLYIEFSTPTYLLLNNTDAFENVDFDVKGLEEGVRLYDLLRKELKQGEESKSAANWQNYFDTKNSEGMIVERALDGYHLEYLPKSEAKEKLRSAVDAGNYALYAKLENPLVIDADGAYWKSIPVPRDMLSSFADDYHSHADENMIMEFENGRTVTNTRSFASFAKRAGYDGVIFNNLKDHGGMRSNEVSYDLDANIYIAFDPNKVASADPVTYDDNGDVIPLSERFDEENKDIRYSLNALDGHDETWYNHHGWIVVNDVLDSVELSSFLRESKRLNSHIQNSDGLYCIPITSRNTQGTYLVLTDGANDPSVKSIWLFLKDDANELINTLKEIHDERTIKYVLSDEAIGEYLEEDEIRFIRRESYPTYQESSERYEREYGRKHSENYGELQDRGGSIGGSQVIRFSLNSEGEELSQGQEIFFERSKNRNAEGQLKVMLHGTDADFTEFDPSKAKPGTLGRAFYFSDSAAHAGQYGNVGRYYLNLENPLTGNTHDITKDQLKRFVAYLAENEDYGIENYGADATVDSVTDSVWGGTDFAMLRDLNLSAVGDFAEAIKVFNRVNDTNYDGIITDIETVAFYPQQIKRTDNLNPTLNKDTRYAITDSSGKVLADGVVNFFKDAQTRDAQGRLQRAFHTTNFGGYDIFDPKYSDDHRCLFFATNFDVSQTYGTHANARFYPYDITNDNELRKYLSSVEGVYFGVLTNDEWEAAKKAGGTLADIKGATGVHEFQYNMAQREGEDGRWSQYKKDNPNANLNAYEFDTYIEAVNNGEINPDDYMLVASYPNYTGSNAYDDSYVNARTPADLGLQLDKKMRMPEDFYHRGMKDAMAHGYYECYINLQNPLIVDAKYSNWNNIPYGEEKNLNNHLIELEDKSNIMISSLMVTQEDITDDGIPMRLEISIRYEKKFDGKWHPAPIYFEHTIELTEKDLENLKWSDAYYLPWQKAEEALYEFGLPKDYVNILEADYMDYEGDIVRDFKTDDVVQFDYINTETGEYEIVDPYEYDNKQETYRTRELAEIAYNNGHDGVIIRNCVDIGGVSKFRGSDTVSDIFIAFNSNQVKDINNDNPTEKPQIKYSIVDEDEALSSIAYEHATDNSIEALQRYEELIARTDVDPETYNIKPFKEDDITKLFAALNHTEAVVYSDPIAEEDRVRMAKSKIDFFGSMNAKWQARWTTDGQVLDVKSVRKDIKNLVMGVMANSDTDAKYRNELVRKMLFDVRTAYQLMKQDRQDVASSLLYHSALRMVEGAEFYVDDGYYDRYLEIKDYFRNTKISLGEEYWSDVDYGAFRKNNYGRMNLVKGKTNVDQIYQELCEWFPEYFNEDETLSVPDQLEQMAHVLDIIQPYKEAYSSEEAAELAFDIADSLYEIMEGGKEVVSLADYYKQRYDAKTKAMKQRHAEAMQKVRENRDKGIQAERAKWQAKEEKRKERTAHNKYFDSISKNHKKLTEKLLTNTKDKHIPEQYKKELAKALRVFDLQTVGSHKRQKKTGLMAQNTIKMAQLKAALSNIENRVDNFNVNDAITDLIDELIRSVEGKTIDELSVTELSKIDKVLKALVHELNNYDKVLRNNKKEETAGFGNSQIDTCNDRVNKFGKGQDFFGKLGALDRIINLDEQTAAYLFRRIDPDKTGIGAMWAEVRKGFDKYVRNTAQLMEWMDEITGKYANKGVINKFGSDVISSWRSFNYAQTFNLTNGTVQLTPAQMMSIYCMAKRPQAYQHMVRGGIVVEPVSFQASMLSDVKKRANKSAPIKLTDADIQQIRNQLTPEQINVAEELQQLMSTKMAAWGNEASMEVIGIELFKEENYFPIKSDKNALESDLSEDQFMQAIRNFGFTKALTPGANNSIIVDDIFKVVTEHCNNMNLYNSYSRPMNDFMKVFNYKQYGEDGSQLSVKQAIGQAFSQKAVSFIIQQMRDLNGNVSGNASGIEEMYNNLLGSAKAASVMGNMRVLLQQPTAITRAFAVIDPKYIKGIKITKGILDEMFEHCPIAQWKSWGYYDINMGRSIEDVIMNEGSWKDTLLSDSYGKADNMTWAAIWMMVKNEMKDTHPELQEGTEEYWEAANERMSEIVDLTQVVDSPIHRSHGMRSKNYLLKTATAFMAEPTLTFNMFKDGLIRAIEAYKAGDHKAASKIAGRTMAVLAAQATAVSLAQALWDTVRGKGGDDDEDEEMNRLKMLWNNFLESMGDEAKIWNKIYFIKDIDSLIRGYGFSNMALQGFKQIIDGWNQLTGKKKVFSSKKWYENLFGGIGYVTGMPIQTLIRDAKALYNLFGVEWKPAEELGEYLDSMPDIFKGSDEEAHAGSFFAQLIGKADTSEEEEEPKYENVPTMEELTEEHPDWTDKQKEEVIKAAEKRAKKENAAPLTEDELLYKAIKGSAGMEDGEEKDKKIYNAVSDGINDIVAAGNYAEIDKRRRVIQEAGGDTAYFDSRVMAASKAALKKSIKFDATAAEITKQDKIQDYLTSHGMTQEEISADIVYKSDGAKDLKVACRLGDEELMVEALRPLVQAGLTYDDFVKLYENRNRMDLSKYNGRYKDKLKSTGKYVWPTQGTITSEFGYRNAPTAGASSYHQGIDIGAPTGTPVVAADGGVVIFSGWHGASGKRVAIKHDDGTITYYNHLSWWNANEGDTVAQGTEIGQVGSTGVSTGPHLDFRVEKNGKLIDPMKYLQERAG